jgi:hypothetical protein
MARAFQWQPVNKIRNRLVAMVVVMLTVPVGFAAGGEGRDELGDNTAESGEPVRPGSWGGEHVAMNVTHAGATLEFDCAFGRIDESLITRRDGQFEVPGVVMLEVGGPVAPAQPSPEPLAALYRGRIDGSRMVLTVMLQSWQDKPFGVFLLGFGQRPQLDKCL